MSADGRCGIDLDAAVDTYESIGSIADERNRTSSDGSHGTAGVGSIGPAGDESIATAVVSAVADAKGVDPLDLEPLYEVVDGDALDAMFAEGDGSSSLELRFSMAGCEVVVRGAGEVTVTPPTQQGGTEAALSHGD